LESNQCEAAEVNSASKRGSLFIIDLALKFG